MGQEGNETAQPMKACATKPDAEFHPQNPHDRKRENQLPHVVFYPSRVRHTQIHNTTKLNVIFKTSKDQGRREHSALS